MPTIPELEAVRAAPAFTNDRREILEHVFAFAMTPSLAQRTHWLFDRRLCAGLFYSRLGRSKSDHALV
jgi:hypothetical protein